MAQAPPADTTLAGGRILFELERFEPADDADARVTATRDHVDAWLGRYERAWRTPEEWPFWPSQARATAHP